MSKLLIPGIPSLRAALRQPPLQSCLSYSRSRRSPDPLAPGGALQLTAQETDSAGKTVAPKGTLTWSSNNPQVSVDATGLASASASATGSVDISVVDSGAPAMRDTVSVPIAQLTYRGLVSISGPATAFSTCTGTMSVLGTATTSLGSAPSLHLDSNEIFAMNCFSQTVFSSLDIPLTVSGDNLTGTVTFPFTCAPPCVAGQSNVLSRLEEDNQRPNHRAGGHVDSYQHNQSPLTASAAGTVSLSADGVPLKYCFSTRLKARTNALRHAPLSGALRGFVCA